MADMAEGLEPADVAEVEALTEETSPGRAFPPPSIRDRLPAELEDELNEAIKDLSTETLEAGAEEVSSAEELEPDSKRTGRVVSVHREDVIFDIGVREQGVAPLKQFTEPPEVGSECDVIVRRFDREDGFYELSIPHAAVSVGDWSQVSEGMLVEARVTGHNTGGLECEVSHIRGFIPASQIALYHVENLAEFVDQKLLCLVTEANPQRRNLVLSRRAVLEKEKEEARKALLESLVPGETREGVVRKIMDFGAFVDLGGVDGLVHVSRLSWGRVENPSDVLQVGQTIKVKVEKVDKESGRISLSYRDTFESPWTGADKKYPVNSQFRGKVTRIMDFGAFVELEPGVEGLVHISELSHKRVWRTSDVVSEGQEVDVIVLSVDTEAQRISLSMKATLPEEPEKGKDKKDEPAAPAAEPARKVPKRKQPLKGGLGRSPGGQQYGLKW